MKSTRLLAITLTITLLGSTSATAVAETPAHELHSLESYIHYGLTHSPKLKAAYERYRATAHRIDQETALPNPKFSYGYFLQSVETRVGPQEHKISIAQAFPWFGTLSLRGERATAEATAAFHNFHAAKNALVFEIISTYAELAYATKAIEINKDILALLQSWEQVLQERFKTSSSSHNDLIKLQIELGKLEDTLQELQDTRIPIKSKLNALLNRDDAHSLSVDPDEIVESQSFSAHPLSLDEVIEKSPDMAMIEASLNAQTTNVELAKKTVYPDLSFGVEYIGVGERSVAGGGDDAVMATVAVDLPVYWKKNTAQVQEAHANRRRAEHGKQQTIRALQTKLAQINHQIRNSQRKILLYKQSLLPKTKEAIEASYTAYESGDAVFLDVIYSEQALLKFQLALTRAYADNLIASAAAARIQGAYTKLPIDSKEQQ